MPEEPPQWAQLDFHQCPHCTLTTQSQTYCPIALRLSDVVERCGDLLSYDDVHVDVKTMERCISQYTSVQIGISALMGVIMATSGCPHMAFFKPMARFHLPMASDEETLCRAVSMYLLAQYLSGKAGGKADFELEGLKEIYRNVQQVNASIADRLRCATEADSSVNAVVTLDMFAKGVLFEIEESLEDLRFVFAPYLKDPTA
jgi:hypothetical protein